MSYNKPNTGFTKADWYSKQKVVFDIECYINYFLLVVYDYETMAMLGYWEMFNDAKNHSDPMSAHYFMQDKHLISFNGVKYDEMMLSLFCHGGTNADLKSLSDAIIVGQGGNKFNKMTRWKYNITPLPVYLHTDLIEPAFGSASLKVYGARLKLPKLEELPVDPSAIITEEQVPVLLKYCINDCYVTAKLFEYLLPALELRLDMGKDYDVGLEFVNKSDAQIADSVVAIEYQHLTKTKLVKPNLHNYPTHFKYTAPPWIKFQTDYLQADLLELAEDIVFEIDPKSKKVKPAEEFKTLVELDGKSFQIAIGGIHSVDDQGSYFADDDYELFNFDVGSFYPWIIQNGEFHPAHIPYQVFKTLYQTLIDKRMNAKALVKEIDKELSEIDKETTSTLLQRKHLLEEQKRHEQRVVATVKIILNGLYGQLSQQYSNVFDSKMLAHVTITGQLAMLMLIEGLYLENVQVVSANTDGITVRCPRSKQADVEMMVKQWCADTGFTMDYEHYQSIHYLSVNSYFYLAKDGHIHGIGDFADDGIRKSQDCSVVRDACFEFVRNGTPIEDTIFDCREIDSFVTLTKINNGAVQNDGYDNLLPVGSVIRFYRSYSSEYPIQRAKPNKSGTHNKVPKSDNAKIVNDYPDEFPSSDIRYPYYFKECYRMLLRMGLLPEDGQYYRNAIDDCVGYMFPKNKEWCEKSVDKGYMDEISFSQFLQGIGVDKPYLRKNKLSQWVDLIPVKKRKKKGEI